MKNGKLNEKIKHSKERPALCIGVMMASLLLSGCGDDHQDLPRQYYEEVYTAEGGCLHDTGYDRNEGAVVMSMVSDDGIVRELVIWGVGDKIAKGEPRYLSLAVIYSDDDTVDSLVSENKGTTKLWESKDC
ncbi:hypothetical protein KC867_01540 [Candidatus Saccharibacteria bacterium]|nr:hypothetical protein [Candidatus Saccharibacteria bacterium]